MPSDTHRDISFASSCALSVAVQRGVGRRPGPARGPFDVGFIQVVASQLTDKRNQKQDRATRMNSQPNTDDPLLTHISTATQGPFRRVVLVLLVLDLVRVAVDFY